MPQRCLEQGFVRAVICRNCATDNQQQHLLSNTCAAARQQHHLPSNTCALGWQQPHPAPNTCVPSQAAASSPIGYLRPRPGGSLIRRRYGGGVGNRCRWAERFALFEQMQSMERHFQRSRELFRTDRGRPCPREWEDPQAKRCGGMERSGSLCGRGCRSAEASALRLHRRRGCR